MSHHSAIGDTISCDAPYSAIGFRGKIFLRYPPCWVCLWTAIGHFMDSKWGCSSDSLQYHRKHSATRVLLHLSRDRRGYFGRVTKVGKVDVQGFPTEEIAETATAPWVFLLVFRSRVLVLVAQSSATGVTVAATPPCSAIRFRNPKVPRYPPPARRDAPESATGGSGERCDTLISGGVARFWRDISDSAGMWCDILCATLCSAIGVSTRICH